MPQTLRRPRDLHPPDGSHSKRAIPPGPPDVNGGLTMTTAAARCIYALRPVDRPNCQLTATVTYGGIALCSACEAQRSTLGKGQTRRRLPDTQPDPIALLADARLPPINPHEQFQAPVIRARQPPPPGAAIARVLGTPRQAAQ